MADDVLLTNIKLEGASQVQDDLKRIGDDGARAFEKLSQSANQRFDQISTALVKVSQSLDRVANTRIEINTDRANQALDNIARVADQLSRRLENLGQPGSRSLEAFNQTSQKTQQQVVSLEGTVTSAFGSISQSGVSAFTLINNTIQDSIKLFENYKKTALALATGGIVGGIVKSINDAVSDFNELKKAASGSGIDFAQYQKLNFILRDMGVGAKDSAKLMEQMGQRAKDLKAVVGDGKGITVTQGDKKSFFPVDDEGKVSRASVIEDTKKLAELNAKLASGGFGDKDSFEALHKYRQEVDAMRASMAAAEKHRIITIPDADVKKLEAVTKGFSLDPTTDSLRKLIEEVNKLGESSDRIEAFKKAFGGNEAAAKALEKSLDTETIDKYIERQQKLQTLREKDGESAKTLEDANKKLNAALFEVGAASEQGRIGLGLTFAPILAPAIDAIAEGIRSLNLNFRELGQTIGKDIGPAISQLFNLFRDGGKDFVALPKDNMFSGFVDGIKTAKDIVGPIIADIGTAIGNLFTFVTGFDASRIGDTFSSFFTNLEAGFEHLITAMKPVLDAFNAFFGTNLTVGDVGLVAILSSLAGGFNTLGVAAVAAFGKLDLSSDKTKQLLADVGIDIDEIVRKAKVFGAEIPKAIAESFESNAERDARLRREQQEKQNKPSGIGSDTGASAKEADQGIKQLARTFVSLGEAIFGTGVALAGFRRTLTVLGTLSVLDSLTGIVTVVEKLGIVILAVANSFIAFSGVMGLIGRNPFIAITIGLILLLNYGDQAIGIFDSLANTINRFATSFSGGLIPPDAISGLGLLNTAIIAFEVLLAGRLIVTLGNATKAMAAFIGVSSAGLLLTLGVVGLLIGAWVTLNDLIKGKGVSSTNKLQLDQLEKQAESIQKFRDEMAKKIELGQFTGSLEQAKEDLKAIDESLQAVRDQIKNFNEDSKKGTADADKGAADSLAEKAKKLEAEKSAWEKLLQQMLGGGAKGSEAAPTTPDVPELKAGPDEEIVIVNGKPYKVKKSRPGGASEISGPVQVASLDPSSGIAGRGRGREPQGRESDVTPAQDALITSTNNLNAAEGTLNSSLSSLQAAVDSLSTAVQGFSTALASVGEPLSSLAGASGSLAGSIAALVEALGGIAEAVGGVIEAFGRLPGSVGSLVEAFGGLATSAGALGTALDGTKGSASDLTATMDGLLKAVVNAIGAINNLASSAQNGGAEVAKASYTAPTTPGTGGQRPPSTTTKGGISTRTGKVTDSETGQPTDVSVSAPTALTPEQKRARDARRKQREEQARQEEQQGQALERRSATSQGTGTSQGGLSSPTIQRMLNEYLDRRGLGIYQGGSTQQSALNEYLDRRGTLGRYAPSQGGAQGGSQGGAQGGLSSPTIQRMLNEYIDRRAGDLGDPFGRGAGSPAAPSGGKGAPIPVTPVDPQGQRLPSSIEPVETTTRDPRNTVPRNTDGPRSMIRTSEGELVPAAELFRQRAREKELAEGRAAPDTELKEPAAAILERARKRREDLNLSRDRENTRFRQPKLDFNIDDALKENRRILEGPPPGGPSQLDVPGKRGIDPNLGADELNLDDFEGALQRLSSVIEPLGAAFGGLVNSATNAATATGALSPALDQTTTSAQSTTQALEPVTPALEQVSTSAQQVPEEVNKADQAFEQIDLGEAAQEVQQFVQDVNRTLSNLSAPQSSGRMAGGGLITGPGTDTSDSIPIFASANEFMVRAAAVRHYGKDFMHRVNSMSFPRFAMGGLIDVLNTPLSGQIRVPRFADGGSIGGGSSPGGVPVHVNFEGKRVFSASASRTSIEQLKRESLMQKVRSGGPSPFWVD